MCQNKVIKLFLCLIACLLPQISYANNGFSFIEYNLAFILGLSLPVIIITFALKHKFINAWYYPAILTTSLLFLLTSINRTEDDFSNLAYMASASFIAFLSLLPRTIFLTTKKNIKSVLTCNLIILLTTVILLMLTWFNINISQHILWASFTIIIMLVSFVRLTIINQLKKRDNFRFSFLWLLIIGLTVIIFVLPAWQYSQMTTVILASITYVFAMINFSWLITFNIRDLIKDETTLEVAPQLTELQNLAKDAVTDLPSQSKVISTLRKLPQQENTDYAIVVFKPINFNKMNTTLGHQNTDLLLLQLAYSLKKQTENNNTLINFDSEKSPVRIARLPSLQFLVILKVTDIQHETKLYIDELIQQLSASVPKAMSFKSISLNFELTFGVNLYQQNNININEEISFACDALMSAEQQQNKLVIYNHQKNHFSEENLLEMGKLHKAIEDNVLQWQLQPQINIHTKAVTALSLSAFWHKEKQKLSLREFIDTAENSGEIFVLIKQMIKQACQLASKLSAQNIKVPISLDFASHLVIDDTVIQFISQQLVENKVNPKYLLIEVPEPVFLQEKDRSQRLIDQLKNLQIGIVIDNFSGNYDILKYLRKLSLSQVKIDCGLLSLQEERQSEKAIINALVNLTQIMHIPTVGTNINNAGSKEVFNDIGGSLAQGNIISPMININDIIPWLRDWLEQYQ